jgi:hypothetical protein
MFNQMIDNLEKQQNLAELNKIRADATARRGKIDEEIAYIDQAVQRLDWMRQQ